MSMSEAQARRGGTVGLDTHGVSPSGNVWWNLPPAALYEHALAAGTGKIAEGGPLVVETGVHTGRQPKDRFVVEEPGSKDRIWWGEINQPISEAHTDGLRAKLQKHLAGVPNVYVIDAYVGGDPKYRMAVRLVSESAWHSLFAQTMFIRPDDSELDGFTPETVILHAPSCDADPATDGTRKNNFVVLHPTKKEILIGGTYYGGEIKKSVFSLMQDILPNRGILSMHCSANVGADGNTAIFFGLSGTGKTTLSTDAERPLIGDDEHGWSDDGVFNIEGGCYAKVIHLSETAEPEIYETTRRFGTVLENVVMDPVTRKLDLDDDSKTENTRAAYPLSSIPNAIPEKRAGHPTAMVMLSADAFGVLPPVAKLTTEEAMTYFLAGYTAKVAGTEVGVVEPQATFSSCFGAAFLPQAPHVYADMLGELLTKHGVQAWLVNTGWTGGAYGTGSRMPIAATRAIVRAAVSGELNNAETRTDPVFGFQVPVAIEGVDPKLLDPRGTWTDGAAYDASAQDLAARIQEHAAKMRA
ncbi:MAG TPA: phosphoenolpyruvate carboxykinase (ATP) [Miltoncostaeaceae bacterium]|nr:phosphoenolpyruvate carboxykinase (ATP) [Miltoncostaeaceae bacterium]